MAINNITSNKMYSEEIEARNVKVGDFRVWNGGSFSKIIKVEFSKTGKTLNITSLYYDEMSFYDGSEWCGEWKEDTRKCRATQKINIVSDESLEIAEENNKLYVEKCNNESKVNNNVNDEIVEKIIKESVNEIKTNNNNEVEEMKVLYFEGAGMNTYEAGEDVGNYRIRTAFINNEGQEIYLELGGTKFDNKNRNGWYWRVDHVFNLSISKDENESRINVNKGMFEGYTKENITNWVNDNLNCNFETMEVLDDMEGYRVHGGYKDGEYQYNLMNNHKVNRARTEARKKVYNDIKTSFKEKSGEKFPCISVMAMDDEGINIRYNGYESNLVKTGITDRDQRILVNY